MDLSPAVLVARPPFARADAGVMAASRNLLHRGVRASTICAPKGVGQQQQQQPDGPGQDSKGHLGRLVSGGSSEWETG